MSLSLSRIASRLLVPTLCFAASTACGGIALDPGGSAGESPSTPPVSPESPPPVNVVPPPVSGPFSPRVSTNDVSILYPLPTTRLNDDFIPASDIAAYGPLVPEAVFKTVVRGAALERTNVRPSSGYDTLRIVAIRLDPCSARSVPEGKCRSEVRLVFQALYTVERGDGTDVGSTAATDGGLHVMYDVPSSELVAMTKEILALKKANGDLASDELGPHPILKAQGLGGAFAQGLRGILRFHLGESRIGRVTFFDHNFEPDSDGWTFGVFDRAGSAFVAGKIPGLQQPMATVAGSSAEVSLAESSAEAFSRTPAKDSVGKIVSSSRSEARPEELRAAYDAAIRVENPTMHTAETTDCINCHLAEGARRMGESVYRFSPGRELFASARRLDRKDERTSVTNLHAFGYLHRQVSITQRTANESAVAATALEAMVK